MKLVTILVFILIGCTDTTHSSPVNIYALKCGNVSGASDGINTTRCANHEVVCYYYNNHISCVRR